MKNILKQTTGLVLIGIAVMSCGKNDGYDDYLDNRGDIQLFSAAGDSSAIIGKINQFRDLAGKALNSTPNATGGRREINWDGVPAEFTSPGLFPANFFNLTDPAGVAGRKRGLVYTPENAQLLVSDRGFSDIDQGYSQQFFAFSKNKVFSAKGTNITEVKFFVPGTHTPAYVSSFGIIFSDVDIAGSTGIEVYDGDKLIGRAGAQAADKKFSFLGLSSSTAKFTRVRIVSGNTALANGVQDGSTKDVVVMDDLIYSEPVAR